jgi:flavin reductase (DIM6/NTAB) family NADH-FMN oxidoreductase RutF
MFSIGINRFREFPSMDLLPKCAIYVQLTLLSITEAGDHDVALCKVVGTGAWDETEQGIVSKEVSPAALDPTTALYTAQLRAEGII